MSKLSVLIFSLLLAGAVRAQTVTCSQSALQSALNSASPGSTVTAAAGGSTTITSLNIPAGVILNLNGCNITDTTENGVTLNMSGTQPSAILNGNWNSNGNQAIFIDAYGEGPGVISGNTFNAGEASEMIHNMGEGAASSPSTEGWNDTVTPGGPIALYIENNTFVYNASGNPAYDYGTMATEGYYGSRTVFRHNTLNMVEADQHGTPGNVWARWWEIYDNSFNTAANGNQSAFITLRGGSGLVFGNVQTGANQGAGNIQLWVECGSPGVQCTSSASYPQLYQVGRGISQCLSPAYFWGNTGQLSVVAQSPLTELNRDYYVSTTQPATMVRCQETGDTASTTYSYTPYTYPYPLSGSGPNPPTNVTIIVN